MKAIISGLVALGWVAVPVGNDGMKVRMLAPDGKGQTVVPWHKCDRSSYRNAVSQLRRLGAQI